MANLTNPLFLTTIITVNDPGYLWGISADGNRLWFVKGTPIAFYDGTPDTAVSADKVFSISDMCDYIDGNLNSACFIAPSKTALCGVSAISAPKSLASHIRLAHEARMLAEEAKKKWKMMREH